MSTDEWLNYFKGLFNLTEINQYEDVLRNITQDHESEDLDIPISDQEIINSTKSIHTNRSPGPDGVCIEMLKETLTTILPYLKVLFNDIFNSGIYPEDWGGGGGVFFAQYIKMGTKRHRKIIEGFQF